jgi:peptide/nickel transport system ATP-binding protein
MVLSGGHVVESGITPDVIGRPEHPYTRELIADTPTLAGLVDAAAVPVAHSVERPGR